MATANLPRGASPAFVVVPTTTPVYLWRIVAVETNRTISRHKDLEPATEKAEKLNSQTLIAAEQVSL
jgi:hypothetical protein